MDKLMDREIRSLVQRRLRAEAVAAEYSPEEAVEFLGTIKAMISRFERTIEMRSRFLEHVPEGFERIRNFLDRHGRPSGMPAVKRFREHLLRCSNDDGTPFDYVEVKEPGCAAFIAFRTVDMEKAIKGFD